MARITPAVLDIDVSDGTIAFASPLAAELLGFDNYRQMLGHVAHDLFHHSYPDGSPFPRERCQLWRAVETDVALVTPFEVFWRNDGVAMPVRVALTRLETGDIVLSFIDLSEEVERELSVRVAPPGETMSARSPLTARERAILDYLLENYTNQRIADDLFLAEKTVKNLLSRIYFKLGVAGRSEAAALWEQVSSKGGH